MLQIWGGTKFSNFVRYWLGKRRTIREFYYNRKGLRKCGAFEKIDERDIRILASEIVDLRDSDGIDTDNLWVIGQGETTQCVCHQVAFALSSLATRTFHRRITFDPQYIKKLMVERGYYKEGEGAIITNGLKAVRKECLKSGFVVDTEGNKYFIPNYKYVESGKDWRDALKKLHYIVTGLYVRHPMCDDNWFYRPQTSGGGHSVGAFNDSVGASKLKTSWDKYGIKQGKTQNGNFWCRHTDEKVLMRGWIFPTITKIASV